MLLALQSLHGTLKTVAQDLQELRDGLVTHGVTATAERRSKMTGALGRPAQRRHGIASRHRVDEFFKTLEYSRRGLLDAFTPAAFAPGSSRCQRLFTQLSQSLVNGRPRETRRTSDDRDTTSAKLFGIRGGDETSLTFIQMLEQQLVSCL